MYLCVHEHTGRKTICRSQFSFHLGIELRISSGMEASTFTDWAIISPAPFHLTLYNTGRMSGFLLFFLKILFLIIRVCVHVGVNANACRCPQRLEALDSPGLKVTSGCELVHEGAVQKQHMLLTVESSLKSWSLAVLRYSTVNLLNRGILLYL